MPELELPSLEALAGMPKEQRDALIDSLPDEQLNALYRQHEPQIKAVQQERFAKLPPLTETFPKDVERGLYTTGAGYLGAADTARALVGADSDYFAKEQDRLLRKAAEIPGSVGSWTGVDFTSPGQMGRYVAEGLGENLVQLGSSVIPAAGASKLASVLGFAKAAPKIAAGIATASNIAQETGGIAGDIRGYTGKPLDFGDAAAALATGTSAGMLEAIGDVKLLKALIPDEAARKAFGANLGKSFLARTADFAAKTGLNGLEQGMLEFATEVPQSVVESIPVAWMKAGKTDDFLKNFYQELTSDEKLVEYLDSGLKGFSSGGPTGAGAYAIGRGAAAIGDEINRKRAERVLAELKQFAKDNPAPDTASVTPRTEEPAAAAPLPQAPPAAAAPPAAPLPQAPAPYDLSQLVWDTDAGLTEAPAADDDWDVRTGLPRLKPTPTIAPGGKLVRPSRLSPTAGTVSEATEPAATPEKPAEPATKPPESEPLQLTKRAKMVSKAFSVRGLADEIANPFLAWFDTQVGDIPTEDFRKQAFDRFESMGGRFVREVLPYSESPDHYRNYGLSDSDIAEAVSNAKYWNDITRAEVEKTNRELLSKLNQPQVKNESPTPISTTPAAPPTGARRSALGFRSRPAAEIGAGGRTLEPAAKTRLTQNFGQQPFPIRRPPSRLAAAPKSDENQIPPASPVPVVESQPAEAPPAKPPEGRAAPGAGESEAVAPGAPPARSEDPSNWLPSSVQMRGRFRRDGSWQSPIMPMDVMAGFQELMQSKGWQPTIGVEYPNGTATQTFKKVPEAPPAKPPEGRAAPGAGESEAVAPGSVRFELGGSVFADINPATATIRYWSTTNPNAIGRLETADGPNGEIMVENHHLDEELRGQGNGGRAIQKLQELTGRTIVSDERPSAAARSMWDRLGAKREKFQITPEETQYRYVLRVPEKAPEGSPNPEEIKAEEARRAADAALREEGGDYAKAIAALRSELDLDLTPVLRARYEGAIKLLEQEAPKAPEKKSRIKQTAERVSVDPKTDELLGTNDRGEPVYWSPNAKTHYSISNGRIRTAPDIAGFSETAIARLHELLTPGKPAAAPQFVVSAESVIDNPSAEAWVKEHLTRAEGRDTGAAWIRNPGGELGGLYEWWKKDFKGRKASAKVKGVQGQSGLALVFKLPDGRFLITSVKEMTIQDRSPYRGGYLPPNTIVPYLRNPDTGKGVAVHRLADPKNLGKLFPLLQGARLEGYTYVGPQYEKKASFSAILTEDQFDRISRTAKTQTIEDQGPGAAPAAARGEVDEATGMREVVAQVVQPDDFAGYKPDDYSRKSIAAVLKELQTTDPKLWLRLLSSTAAIMEFDNHPRLPELIQLNKQNDLSKAEWLVYEVIIEQLRAAGADISAQELSDPDGSLLWDWTKPRGKSQTKPAPARRESGTEPGTGNLAPAQPRTDDKLKELLARALEMGPDDFREMVTALLPEEILRMEQLSKEGQIKLKGPKETRDAAGNKAKFGTKPKEDEEASFPDEDDESAGGTTDEEPGTRRYNVLPEDEQAALAFETEGGRPLPDTSNRTSPEFWAKVAPDGKLISVAAVMKELDGELSEIPNSLKALLRSVVGKVDIEIRLVDYEAGFQGRFTEFHYAPPHIEINPKHGISGLPLTKTQLARVLAHEAIHYLVTSKIRSGLLGQALNDQFFGLFEASKQAAKSAGMAGEYGMSSMDEFVAEAFSNKKFQKFLASIPYSGAYETAPAEKNRLLSLWDGFLRLVQGALNLDSSSISVLEKVLDLSNRVSAIPYQRPIRETPTWGSAGGTTDEVRYSALPPERAGDSQYRIQYKTGAKGEKIVTDSTGKKLRRGDVIRHKGKDYVYDGSYTPTTIEATPEGLSVPKRYVPSELGITIKQGEPTAGGTTDEVRYSALPLEDRDSVRKIIQDAGDTQRDEPEFTMLEVVEAIREAGGPAKLNDLLEHIGDLAHRASRENAIGNVSEKVDKGLRALNPEPGNMTLEQEISNAYENNAIYAIVKSDPELKKRYESREEPLWKLWDEVRSARKSEIEERIKKAKSVVSEQTRRYADSHRDHSKPVTWLSKMGRIAAMELGQGKYRDLKGTLTIMRSWLNDYAAADEETRWKMFTRGFDQQTPSFSALPGEPSATGEPSASKPSTPIPQLIHENNLRQSAALRDAARQSGAPYLVPPAAARQDAEAGLARVRLARDGIELVAPASIDDAYSQTEIGQTLLARARKEGIKLAFIRGLPKSNGIYFQGGILISTDGGRNNFDIESAFEHELAHHKYQQGDAKLQELGRMAKLDSAAAKAMQAFYAKKELPKLEGAALREELVATFVGGTANYEGVPLVGAFEGGARELVQEYLGGEAASGTRDAEYLAAVQASTRSKVSNLLGGREVSAVDSSVGGRIEDSEVLNPIIDSIPVDVVNVFGGKKRASEMLLHNPSVFQDVLITNLNPSVGILGGPIGRAKTMSVVAAIRAELSAFADAGTFDRKMFGAMDALQNNLITLLRNLSTQSSRSERGIPSGNLPEKATLFSDSPAFDIAKSTPSGSDDAGAFVKLDATNLAHAVEFHRTQYRYDTGISQYQRTIPLSKRFDSGTGDIRYSYAGERAELPQFMRDSLETAKAMAAAGKSSEEIRSVTGWFPGKYDGKMRWEVPDAKAELVPSWQSKGTVGEALVHPELFAAYPEARNILLEELLSPGSETASYGGGVIRFRRTAGLSSLLHEIQHWIQEKEGFAKGSSESRFQSMTGDIGAENLEYFERSLARTSRSDFETEEQYQAEIKDLKEKISTAKKVLRLDSASRAYRRTAGEIESRDVQARQSFTPEQRKAIAPYSSENISKEDAIVMFGSSGPQASADEVRFSLPDKEQQARFRQSVKEAELSRGAAEPAAEAAAKQSFENWLSTFKAPAEAVARAAGSSSAKLAEILAQASLEAPEGQRLSEEQREQKRIAKRTLSQSFLRILSRLEREVQAATKAAGPDLLSFEQAKADAAKPPEQQRLSTWERNRIYTRAYEHVEKIWKTIAAFQNRFESRRGQITEQLEQLRAEQKDLKAEDKLRTEVRKQLVALYKEAGLELGQAGAQRQALYRVAKLGDTAASHILAFVGTQLGEIELAADRILRARQEASDRAFLLANQNAAQATVSGTTAPSPSTPPKHSLTDADWVQAIREVARDLEPGTEKTFEQQTGANTQRIAEVVRAWRQDEKLQTLVREVRDALDAVRGTGLKSINGLLPEKVAERFEKLRQSYVKVLQEAGDDPSKLRTALDKLLSAQDKMSPEQVRRVLRVFARKESQLADELAALPIARQISNDLIRPGSAFANLAREIGDADPVGVDVKLSYVDDRTGEYVLNGLPGIDHASDHLLQVLNRLQQSSDPVNRAPDKATAAQWKALLNLQRDVPPWMVDLLDWPSDNTELTYTTDNPAVPGADPRSVVNLLRTADKFARPMRVPIRPEQLKDSAALLKRYLTSANSYIIGSKLEGQSVFGFYDPDVVRALENKVIPEIRLILGQRATKDLASGMDPKSGSTTFGLVMTADASLLQLMPGWAKNWAGFASVMESMSRGLPAPLRRFLYSALQPHTGVQSDMEALASRFAPRLAEAEQAALKSHGMTTSTNHVDLQEFYGSTIFDPLAATYQHADTGRRAQVGDMLITGHRVKKEDIALLELTHDLWDRAGQITKKHGLGIETIGPDGTVSYRAMWDLGPRMVPRSLLRALEQAKEFVLLKDASGMPDVAKQEQYLAAHPLLIHTYAAGAAHNEYKHNYAGYRMAMFRVVQRILNGGTAPENQALGSSSTDALTDLAVRVAEEFNQEQAALAGELEEGAPVPQPVSAAQVRQSLFKDIQGIFGRIEAEDQAWQKSVAELNKEGLQQDPDAKRHNSFSSRAKILGRQSELITARGQLIAPPGWYDYAGFTPSALTRMGRISETPYLLRVLDYLGALETALKQEEKAMDEALVPKATMEGGKLVSRIKDKDDPKRMAAAANRGEAWMNRKQLLEVKTGLGQIRRDIDARLHNMTEPPVGTRRYSTAGELAGRLVKGGLNMALADVLASATVWFMQFIGNIGLLTITQARAASNRANPLSRYAAVGRSLKWQSTAQAQAMFGEVVGQIANTPALSKLFGISQPLTKHDHNLVQTELPNWLNAVRGQVKKLDEMASLGIIKQEGTLENLREMLLAWRSGGVPGKQPVLLTDSAIQRARRDAAMFLQTGMASVWLLAKRGLEVFDNANNLAGVKLAQREFDNLHDRMLRAYDDDIPVEEVGLAFLTPDYSTEARAHIQDLLDRSQLDVGVIYERMAKTLNAARKQGPEALKQARLVTPLTRAELHELWRAGAGINKGNTWNRPSSMMTKDPLTSIAWTLKGYPTYEFLNVFGSVTNKMNDQSWARALPAILLGMAEMSVLITALGLGKNEVDKWWKRWVLNREVNRSTISDIISGRVADPKELMAIISDGYAALTWITGWAWYQVTGRSQGERQGFDANRQIFALNIIVDSIGNMVQAWKQLDLKGVFESGKSIPERVEAAWLPFKQPMWNMLNRYVFPFNWNPDQLTRLIPESALQAMPDWLRATLPDNSGARAYANNVAIKKASAQRAGVNIKDVAGISKNYDAASPYYLAARNEAAAGNIEKALELAVKGRQQMTKVLGEREENGRIVGLSEKELDARHNQRIQAMLPNVGDKKPDADTLARIESTMTPEELELTRRVDGNLGAFIQAATGKTVSPITTRGAASGGGGGGSIAGISGGSSGAAGGSSLSGRSRLSGGSSLGRSRLSGGRLSGSRLSSGRRISSGRISSGRSAMKPKVMGRLRVRSSRLGGRKLRL